MQGSIDFTGLLSGDIIGEGGTTVIANPSGSATDTLNKVQIDETIYSVEGSQGPQGPQGPAGVGVPSGGATGDVLRKDSTTDYDTYWDTLTALDIPYDNTSSGMTATNTQAAITELKSNFSQLDGLTVYKNLTPQTSYADFNDGSTLPLISLTSTIEPIQAGSGDPSPTNIRPISGHTEANVTRCGKNLYKGYDVTPNTERGVSFTTQDGKLNVQGIYTSTGSDMSFSIYSNSTELGFGNYQNYIPLTADDTKPIKAGNYTLTIKTSRQTQVGLYVANELGYAYENGIYADKFDYYANLRTSTNHIKTFELSREGYLGIFIRFSNLHQNDVFDETIEIQLELSSTATTYEPYNGQIYTIQFRDGDNPLTVYGGTLDVVSGELTVTDEYIASYDGETLPATWISDRDVYAEGTTPTTGAEVVYELATPQTYQLTPTQVNSLLGQNYISCDTGNITNIKYLGILNLS